MLVDCRRINSRLLLFARGAYCGARALVPLVLAFFLPPAWGGESALADRFPDHAPTSLVRRMEDAREDVRVQETSPAETRRFRWSVRPLSTGEGSYQRLTHRQDVWYGSTYWTGPDWTRVGSDWHHPGERTPSVRSFTAPRPGKVVVTGRVYKAHLDGDGIRATVLFRGKTIWRAEIGGRDAVGREHSLRVHLLQGDKIRFVVEKRGTIFCDTTRWNPEIRYEDDESYVASRGFSDHPHEDDPWSYEMRAAPSPDRGNVRLLAFDRDWSLLETALRPATSVHVDGRSSPPLLVLADERDESGIVLVPGAEARWSISCTARADGRVAVASSVDFGTIPVSPRVAPEDVPDSILHPYRGALRSAFVEIERRLASQPGVPALRSLRDRMARARIPELPLWFLVQKDWHREDGVGGSADSVTEERYTTLIALHCRRALQLCDRLDAAHDDVALREARVRLAHFASEAVRPSLAAKELRGLYTRVRRLKREIALANPLVANDRIIFTKRAPTSYSHLVMQYYGWRARPGGGIFVLERPGYSLDCHDIFSGRLEHGSILEPRLSYDARRIVFSYVDLSERDWNADSVTQNDPPTEGFYHVFEVDVDGNGLRQLSDGPFDDLMPTYLPDGGIAFVSTRRKGYARCFGPQFSRRWDVYTLHRMDGDGGNIRALSVHDTNEWFPAVSNDGLILYARWDYIDRDAVTHQNLWASRPDGTQPLAVWGNATAKPHCAFQAQPIPRSNRIVFTASAHHSITGGSIVVLDPARGRNGEQALDRITPDVPFPEAESRKIASYYSAPWPLSEDYFLVAYSPVPLVWEPGANPRNALGLYLLDRFQNRELLYRDSEISSTNPCPLRPRRAPPQIATALSATSSPCGEMVVVDVYDGLGTVPRDTIRELRVVQVFPKTTPIANQPPVGMAGEENARAILGTVPVESDGSARFLVPASKPILLQALDADGFAYQTMRSSTYVQPGETVSCIGCHEHPKSPPASKRHELMALQRPPSRIDAGTLGGRPFSFVEVIQPILDRHCVGCHGGERNDGDIDLRGVPEGAFTRSYVSLCGGVNFSGAGTNPDSAARALVPRFGARNQIEVTPPGGRYGARGSRLIRLVRDGHEGVRLDAAELRHLGAWIDLNAVFYGVYEPERQHAQRSGQHVAMPEIQ